MRWERSYTPLAFIVVALACQMAAIGVLTLTTRRAVAFVDDRFAIDYRAFYDASLDLRNGEDPYRSIRYVTPPTAALLNCPLTLLPFERPPGWPRPAPSYACSWRTGRPLPPSSASARGRAGPCWRSASP